MPDRPAGLSEGEREAAKRLRDAAEDVCEAMHEYPTDLSLRRDDDAWTAGYRRLSDAVTAFDAAAVSPVSVEGEDEREWKVRCGPLTGGKWGRAMRLIRWVLGRRERRVLMHPDVQAAFADEETRRDLSHFEAMLRAQDEPMIRNADEAAAFDALGDANEILAAALLTAQEDRDAALAARDAAEAERDEWKQDAEDFSAIDALREARAQRDRLAAALRTLIADIDYWNGINDGTPIDPDAARSVLDLP